MWEDLMELCAHVDTPGMLAAYQNRIKIYSRKRFVQASVRCVFLMYSRMVLSRIFCIGFWLRCHFAAWWNQINIIFKHWDTKESLIDSIWCGTKCGNCLIKLQWHSNLSISSLWREFSIDGDRIVSIRSKRIDYAKLDLPSIARNTTEI